MFFIYLVRFFWMAYLVKMVSFSHLIFEIGPGGSWDLRVRIFWLILYFTIPTSARFEWVVNILKCELWCCSGAARRAAISNFRLRNSWRYIRIATCYSRLPIPHLINVVAVVTSLKSGQSWPFTFTSLII